MMEQHTPQRDMRVDRHRLDDFFEQHPAEVDAVVTALAEANIAYTRVKAQLQELEAELRLHYHQQLSLQGTRPTEKLIEAHILKDQRYKQFQEQLFQALETLERLKALDRVLRERGRSAEELSKLFQTGYWTLSQTPRRAV